MGGPPAETNAGPSTPVAAATSAQDDIGTGLLRIDIGIGTLRWHRLGALRATAFWEGLWMTAAPGKLRMQRFELEESARVRARRVQWRHDEIG